MTITIRLASSDDAQTLILLMEELAQFEKMEDDFHPSLRRTQMFLANADYTNPYHDASDGRRMLAWIAEEDDGRAVGFAVGFYGGLSSFSSTWEFCLHDLFVHPGARRKGLAKLFFKHIADKVIPYVGVISFEVLDWNINAIKLYEGLGAHYCGERIEPDGTTWKQMQIKGDAFMALVRAREASMKRS